MRPRRLAVIGFGRLGSACAEAIVTTEDFRLAGLVRRAERLGASMPTLFRDVPVSADIAEFDASMRRCSVCRRRWSPRPPTICSSSGLPMVECAALDGEAFRSHKERLGRLAQRQHVAAVLGAGWDPGALSLFRGLFALLVPKGHTDTTDRPGISARAVAGVRDALCTELRSADGNIQRYVYVELAPGADRDRVAEAIRSEPLFLEEETLVFPVESVAALEEEGRGIVLERRGTAGTTAHKMLLLEARFGLPRLAAQVMLAAARALPNLPPGAHSLSEVPLSLLLGSDPIRSGHKAI